ncbi:Rid family hydrolase [Streptomyces decoyicus]|uniref:Rid family hydrolase n=1 Tax=Streptomyces decoyicus TaxID=249567 RepID=UPI00345D6B0F
MQLPAAGLTEHSHKPSTRRVGVYAQTARCLDIAERALQDSGASIEDVVRTRIMLTDVTQWKEAARAHGERFASVRPACTFVEVSRFIDPAWLVEVEIDAVIGQAPN